MQGAGVRELKQQLERALREGGISWNAGKRLFRECSAGNQEWRLAYFLFRELGIVPSPGFAGEGRGEREMLLDVLAGEDGVGEREEGRGAGQDGKAGEPHGETVTGKPFLK